MLQATGTKQYDVVQTAVVGVPKLAERGVSLRILSVALQAKDQATAIFFQSPRLVPWRTTLENVILGMELRQNGGLPPDVDRRAHGYLEMVGLGNDIGKYPGMLSGGERQRVALARALAGA